MKIDVLSRAKKKFVGGLSSLGIRKVSNKVKGDGE